MAFICDDESQHQHARARCFFRDHELNILKPKKPQHRTILCLSTGPDSPVYLPLGLGWWESMGIHGNLWSMFNDVWWIRNRIMMSKMFKLLVVWWFVVGFMRLFDHIWSIVSCRGCSNVPTASVYNLSETFESKWPSFWRVDAMEGDAKSVLRSCQIHHNLVRGKTVWGKFFCVKSRWFSLNLVLAHFNNLIIITRKVPGWWFGTFVIFSIYWEFHHPNWRTNQVLLHILQKWPSQNMGWTA